MRWSFTGKQQTRGVRNGRVLRERCPECDEDAVFHEIEITTSAGAFFIDVASETERAFVCSACGETFDLRDTGATASVRARTEDPPARDHEAEAPATRERRAAEQARRDRSVDEELAALERRMSR